MIHESRMNDYRSLMLEAKDLAAVPITVTEAIDADTVAIVQNGKVVATITNLANKESPEP